MDGGHRAVIFDRFQGVKQDVIGEGTHFMIPWLHRPIIFDIRTRPRSVAVATGSKGTLLSLLIGFRSATPTTPYFNYDLMVESALK